MPHKISQHFEVGTYVVYKKERAKVIARSGEGWILVRFTDESVQILRPQALDYERRGMVDSGNTKCLRANTKYF